MAREMSKRRQYSVISESVIGESVVDNQYGGSFSTNGRDELVNYLQAEKDQRTVVDAVHSVSTKGHQPVLVLFPKSDDLPDANQSERKLSELNGPFNI
jgi:hypothetical protein